MEYYGQIWKIGNYGPDEFKEIHAEQEKLYQEYKRECELGNRFPKLKGLDPYCFSEELKNSITEEEFKDICKAYSKEEWTTSKKIKVALALIIFGSLTVVLLYEGIKEVLKWSDSYP